LGTRFRYCIPRKRALDTYRWGDILAVEWTIREVLNWTRGYFKNAGITQPRLEAEILLAHALDVERLHLYLSPDKPLTSQERSRYRTVVQERKSGVPLQHLVGEVCFFGLRFKVRREALIPRPETEELLERSLKLARRDRPTRCIDLGTGAGVIAVCLARFLPEAEVVAVDLSPDALRLARENAAANNVTERIAFAESDWFERVEGEFDLIVSNPPYVATEKLDSLAPEVRDHEPRVALDGGEGGLERIRTLIDQAPGRLRPGGAVLLEVGRGQARDVAEHLRSAGLGETRIEEDVAGVERFVIARCP
jgi:release factor glutamine methyltransferase